MTNLCLIFISLCFFGCISDTLAERSTEKSSDEVQVDSCDLYEKRAVEIVESHSTKKMAVVSKDHYKSSEGGVFIRYFEGNDTLIRRSLFYGETGQRRIKLFYSGDKLRFASDSIILYSSPVDPLLPKISLDSLRVLNVFFNEDEEVVCVKNGKNMKLSLSEISLDIDLYYLNK